MQNNYGTDLRKTFDEEAELYDISRPHYPAELFDTIIKNANLQPGSKLVEIGPGTGQATLPLAEHGFEIIGIELGAALADVARRNAEKYNKVKIITGAFEDVELPQSTFDLVYSATAFHWIKPEVKFSKPHKLLKVGGSLAIINTCHVSDENGDAFLLASQPIYKRYKPGGKYDENLKFNRTSELKADKIDEKLFALTFFHAFPLAIQYTAKEYTQLLSTYSPQISMEPQNRADFMVAIEKLINEEFGGSIKKHFAMTLTMAKRK
jgi:ubiquinone/menaquinone biosynthesis C-methylase UbiE